ncbi:anti-sigma factor [Rubrivivax sp. JA1029]|uniref:anti-sigma factor n=1 Tax=Rubrivivax sp. JA1029 TaxID=2894193 RepID=UPI001E2F3E02|nr:anti-sigma factor [Rubrivivax sp. JA1029]MCC9648370.1 anti-sigma factor [Rubrivivax sp. JA1029]
MKLDTPDERSAAAGECVLGTLAPDERRAFETALAGDQALRAEVAGWQDRLLPLARHAPPVEPPPGLWPAIEARLGPAAPAARPRPAGAPGWWQRLVFWQSLSGAALAASVLLGSAVLTRPEAPAERYVAVLQAPQGGGNGWLVDVRVDAQGRGQLRLQPVAPGDTPPQGRSLQFWTKAPGAPGPRSLGLLRAGGEVALPLERLPGMRAEQLFEITLEPEGGSPLDRPTGPVLFIGRAVQLTT